MSRCRPSRKSSRAAAAVVHRLSIPSKERAPGRCPGGIAAAKK
ncbi:hypothetical protein ACFFX0_20125 [Citricoccus parietis]|uniref:Uncharacterized protein n=1 Tax=Citricoccus parietis TaxID=592307 RepID=A0ABV5G379_9MICC